MSKVASLPSGSELLGSEPPASGLVAVDAEAARLPFDLKAQFWRHRRRYLLGFFLLATYQYAQYWLDTRLKLAVDLALARYAQAAVELGIWMIVVALVAFVVRVLSRIAVFNAGRNAEYELRRILSAKLLTLGPSFYRRMNTGEIMSRVTNDLTQLRLLLGFGVLNVINTVLALISALCVLIPMSGKLTLAALVPLPLLLLVTRGFSGQFFTRTRDAQAALGEMSGRVQASVAGVRVVRSFALEEREAEAFEETNQKYLDKSLGLARLRGSMMPILQIMLSAGVLVVFWYGGHLVMTKQLEPSAFLAFLRALGRLTWPFMSLGFIVGILQRGRASYSRLVEIHKSEPDISDGRIQPRELPRGLQVKNLSFSYDQRPVLENVSFELPAGKSLAIVGRTGGGKSTLALLLARLLPTPIGCVFLGDHDVCDLPLTTVRQVIGYAQQNAFLFSTTVGRNIAFSLDDPDSAEASERAHRAAAEARIAEEVGELPDGFDTVVGERGVQLSGGQKQRVALAAAFVAEPQILILDDPLSAVDARTERGILDAIDRQRRARSLILITHRVAAAAHCDHILVLDQGRIVESGTHEELRRAGGQYAVFAEEQRIERELQALEGEPIDDDPAPPGMQGASP
ncbi:MAG TPA: ABC transporter ATP-binding protein [Polyangiaceae bacterium]|nr:ABC transporter ATP-binding protein [Polyangiaceae bacterium]